MKTLTSLFLVLVVAACVGCIQVESEKSGNEGSNASGGEGINIEWPGGGVKIGEGTVDVQAPGVDVQVDPSKGVKVNAPDVEVKVDRNTRVDVE